MLEYAIDPAKEKTDALFVPVCRDRDIHWDKTVSALVKRARGYRELTGECGDALVFYEPPEANADRVLLLGAGKLEKIGPEKFRELAGKALREFRKWNLSKVAVAVPSGKKARMEALSLMEALMEGAYLGNHTFDRYKGEKDQQPVPAIRFRVKPEEARVFASLPQRVEAVCGGTLLARDWVCTPPNDKKPEAFARSIADHAREWGVSPTVLHEEKLRELGFGALIAVGSGSSSRPAMVILEYDPVKAGKTICLVGKGVTFDTGGINLKPIDSLEHMKSDMSGAAAVAAAVMAMARLQFRHRIVALLPLVENMPSGEASRPGDVVRTYSGKTVEIGNTDAEGRLILADAISYGIRQYRPDMVLDMATLTGACMVGLGERIAGVFSADDDLAGRIVEAGEKTHERCWRMPLPEDYREFLKSDVADIRNMSSSRYGGAITAALFLSEFVEKTPWAHIDIAGPAYDKKESAYCGPGGTGFGVRLLCSVLSGL